MGLGGRKPLLPAPTESLVDESAVEEPEVVDDLATDLSQRTDRTHHTIPEDGSPITISTKKPTSGLSKIIRSNQASQTSLLIEYFEGGKGTDPNRRPSVRVKVVPSSKSKNKGKPDGHIVLTEAGVGPTKKATSRRISLSSTSPKVAAVDSEISVLDSLTPEGVRGTNSAPVDIEIQQQSDISDMSASPEARYIAAPSDMSSMPADSMLGAQQSTLFAPPTKYTEGSNVSSIPAEESLLSVGSDPMESSSLKPPVMPRERNLSNERITQKVIEKLSNKPRDPVKVSYGQSSKSSSRSAGRDVLTTSYDRNRLAGKNFRETDSTLSPTEPSVLSSSVVSAGGRSDHSARSAATNNSINNPKLLQTVEDAIRRLILPELKELKREHSHKSSRHERDYDDLSETSVVREKSNRRSTSGSKPRRKSSKDHTGSSGSRRRKSSHREEYESMSDSSSRRDESVSSISDPALAKKHAKGSRTRDTAAAAAVGGLTAAALQERESEESLQQRRRRKRSKSRSSRSASVAESEEIFHRHKVPPMPMQSDINSDLTRSSILSSNTALSQNQMQPEVREVSRGAPRDIPLPAINTLPRQSGDLRQTLGMYHGNFSEHNLSSGRLAYEDREDDDTLSPETARYDSFSAEDLLGDPERMRQYERNLHTQHPIRRGLSPIQSVASYQTMEPNRHSMMQPRSTDSFASTKQRQQQLKEEVSISSFTSAEQDLKKNRPQGISLENRSEIMRPFSENLDQSPEFQHIKVQDRFADDDRDSYRDSFTTDNQSVDNKRLSGITDASSDMQYLDKVTAGQHVVGVSGARPEYVPAPFGVESGVASLVEPSVLSMQESQDSHKSASIHERGSHQSMSRDVLGARLTSPLKEPVYMPSEQSLKKSSQQHVNLSPAQSPARSYDEDVGDYISTSLQQSRTQSPKMKTRLQEKGSPESEITTNPSVIHGPIGGLGSGHPDAWMADTSTPPMTSQGGVSRDFDLIPEGLNVSQRNTYEQPKHNTYVIGQAIQTPPGIKDEGYATGDNYPSPGPVAKIGRSVGAYDLDNSFGPGADDSFALKRKEYMSGLSQGLSPFYEGATGKGIDRIQNNDIVALMEHLTVRDAQRNARDTEILVTLVRSAADMRNSFEEMRTFIAEQDEMIMATADEQHEKTQKVIGGPRPQPASRGMSRVMSQEDTPAKRKNVFKRALQGLGSKNTAELQNIESMLMHLLDEVEALRSQQGTQAPTSQARSNSIASDDHARPPTDTGYEPEGRAGTAGTASSGGDRSAFFSNNSSRQGQYSAARRVPENRVSTVMEGDEEYDDYNGPRQVSDNQRTPKAQSPSRGFQRGQSEPLNTPPRMHNPSTGATSNENTPTMSYDSSGKKQKTFSSFLPKVVSRWSKTTASTEPEYRQSTQSKPRPYSQVSRSGSALHEYEYENNPEDRLRSTTSLQDDAYYRDQENRPPSPLVPSAVSDNPKYQAHRNSQGLIHPQPRQGPTGRYQFRLENAAQTYPDEAMSPVSQASTLHKGWDNPQQRQDLNHIPRTLSPISDIAGEELTNGKHERRGSASSLSRRTGGPPRPPKINESELSEPLVPQRPSKVPHGTMSPNTYVDDVRAARAGSPAFDYDKSPVGALRTGAMGRKPSGPRPLSSSSNKDMQKRARFTNSPVQSIGSEGDRY